MTADLHAIWLDDLAPGEGSTPIFDALFAEVDDETRAVILRACADEHTEPAIVPAEFLAELEATTAVESHDGFDIAFDPDISLNIEDKVTLLVPADVPFKPKLIVKPMPTATPKPKKKPTPRKPAAKKPTPRKKPGVLADAEIKLAGVAARVKAQTDGLGGAS